MTAAKICGLTTPEALDAALDGGAAFVGAVVFPKSPRHIDPLHGATLFGRARGRALGGFIPSRRRGPGRGQEHRPAPQRLARAANRPRSRADPFGASPC